jgi:hypothetical protein
MINEGPIKSRTGKSIPVRNGGYQPEDRGTGRSTVGNNVAKTNKVSLTTGAQSGPNQKYIKDELPHGQSGAILS